MAKRFYKHPQYGRIYGDKLLTPRLPGAWPALAKPRDPPKENPQAAPRYEITLVIDKDASTWDKDTQDFINVLEPMVMAMQDQYNEKKGQAKLSIESIFIDGDEWDAEKYPYYVGKYLLIARNADLPLMVDAAKKALNPEKFNGGDICRCEVTPHMGPTGLSYKLVSLQRIKTGELAMGGGIPNAGSMIAACEDGETFDEEYTPPEKEVQQTKAEPEQKSAPKKSLTTSIAKAADEAFGNAEPAEESAEESAEQQTEEAPAEAQPQPTAKKLASVTKPAVSISGNQLASQLRENMAKEVQEKTKGKTPPAATNGNSSPQSGRLAAVNKL